MITLPDKQVLKNTVNSIPVTPEILQAYGFKRVQGSDYLYSKHTLFQKGNIILIEYERKTNSALVQPYEKCYSTHIHYYDTSIDYVIYTIRQLEIFLDCYEKINEIITEAETKKNEVADYLRTTLLQR